MKKINTIAWLIAMLMTLVTSPIFATDWGSENVTMQVGETKTLYLPSTVTTKTLKSVTFYSASWNDVEVMSYTDYSVRVKALKATSTPVIVRCDYYYYINNGGYMYQNGGEYDFKVTVEGENVIKPTNISISSTSSVKAGESFYFVPTVTPAKATYKLIWESSDSSIASVNQSGMLTGISAGTANITVTTDNGKSATCKVTVTAKSVTSVNLKSSLSLEVGDTYTLTPTVTPSDAETSYTWSSDNSSVATISQYGVVIAKSAGTANITVTTANGKSATCKVTVNAPKPVEYEVNCHIYDNGKVIYNGTVLTGNESFNVAEGFDVSFTIIPDEDYRLDWLRIDNEDVKDQLVNNVLTIRNIRKDLSLTVSFEKSNIQPEEPVVTTENNFTLGNVTANTGTVVAFPVDMTNKDDITAFQMDLHLPSGISLATDADGGVIIETSLLTVVKWLTVAIVSSAIQARTILLRAIAVTCSI